METMFIYLMVKIPLYAYESLHEMKMSAEHYKRRYHGFIAKLARVRSKILG